MPRVFRNRALPLFLIAVAISIWGTLDGRQVSAAPARTVDGAVIIYGLDTPSEEAFQRLLEADSVRYVCTQQIFTKTGVPRVARERARKLAAAGKRVVLQIWWGPGGDFPWAKYSFANIALDPAIREDFFRQVVDACVDQYGARNLYGVHLLEETGMQFGTDADRRDDPEDFENYEDDGNSYTAPFWSGYGDLPGGMKIANVRRHEADFTRMTGRRFAVAAQWTPLDHHLFARWVSMRLQGEGQAQFARHIHRKYPGLKAFIWDLLLTGGENPRTDFHMIAREFDGLITDVYSEVFFNFLYQRAYRLLTPKLEMIHFAMGGMSAEAGYPYATPDAKRRLTLGAYMAGSDAVGFFEQPYDFSRPESWAVNTDLLGRMNQLPRFRKTSDVLFIGNSVSNIYSGTYAWTGLKYCDFLPTWEAYDVDLSQYRAVILHMDMGGPSTTWDWFWDTETLQQQYGLPGHLDHRAFERFVQRGGVLIISGQLRLQPDSPLFLAREKLMCTADTGNVHVNPLVVNPEGWLKEELRLDREYSFSALSIPVTADRDRVTATPAGYFARYGRGAVFYAPYNRFYDPQEPYDSVAWQDYRQLMTDLARGVLNITGKPAVAREYLADPEVGSFYLQATSDDGRLTGTILPAPKQMRRVPWPLDGVDLLTGRGDIAMGEEWTAALVRRRP